MKTDIHSLLYFVKVFKPSQAKPSQGVSWGLETWRQEQADDPYLSAIAGFDRFARLSYRHLNSNRGMC